MAFKRYLFIALCILLVGFSLRVNGLSRISIDTDEYFTNRTLVDTRYGDGFIESMRRRLTHMPVYFASLMWYPHNHTDFSMRYPSVLWAMITIAMTMRILSHIYRLPRYALIAGAILASHSYFLLLSQQARMYPLSNALVVSISYLFLYYLNYPKISKTHWFIAQLLTMVAYLTHVSAVIVIIGQGLSWCRLYLEKRATIPRLAYWLTLQMMLITPAIVWALLIFNRDTDGLTWIPDVSLERVFFVIQTLLVGQFAFLEGDPILWILLIVALLPVMAFFVFIRRINHAEYWVGLTVMPLVGILAISPLKNLYHERYFAIAMFAYVIVLILGIRALAEFLEAQFPRFGYRFTAGYVGLLLVIIAGVGIRDTAVRQQPIFEHLAGDYIVEHGQAGDAIASTRSILQVAHYVEWSRYKLFFQSDPEFVTFKSTGETSYDRVWIIDNAYVKPVDWLVQLDATPVLNHDGNTLYLYPAEPTP